MESIKIGKIKLNNKLFLAPMVDVSNLAYRLLCRKNGCSIAYTEMLHIQSLLHYNKNEKNKCRLNNKLLTSKNDNPVGIQLTGSRVKDFTLAIKLLHELIPHKFNLIDLNCGCPSHLTIDNKSGAFLLTKPEIISNIIQILKNESFIVTVKIRTGYNKDTSLKLSRLIEKSGADALTVHARLATHGRSVPANWEVIKKIKKNIGIPLIGNGDIDSPKKVKEMLEIADGAMIARAAIGNPLIFKQSLDYLRNGKARDNTFIDRINEFKKFLELSKKYGLINIPQIKYIGSNFIKNSKGASKLRHDFMRLQTFEEMKSFINEIK